MTNEEAFNTWLDDFHIEEHPNYQQLRDFAFAGWEARLAYMQEVETSSIEKDKLVEHCCPECGCHFVGEFPFNYKVKQNKSAEQSEPYAYTDGLGSLYFDGNPDGDIPLFTSPQRQQPLKRLSKLDVLKILNECAKSPYTNTQSSLGFANAIMDAMQELNK